MQICNRRIRSGLTFWNMRQFLNSVLLPSSANTAFVWDSLNSDVDLESLLIRDRFPDARASQGLIIALYLPGFFPLQFLGGDRGSCILGYFSPCSCSVPFVVSTNLGVARRVLCSWGPELQDRLPSFLASFSTCDKSCLKVVLEGWNASFWWRSVHPSGISTLSSGARSTIVPPEWPWMARKWMRRPSEPKQHWSLFLSLPRRRRFSHCEFEKTPDTSSSAITASREQQRTPTTFVKDPSMTSFAARISIHFLSSTGLNILEGGYDGGLGYRFPRAISSWQEDSLFSALISST